MDNALNVRLRAALADRYELHEELGAGGMATVYLADDLKHERKVAVKVLRPELAAVIGGERFITEIKTTAALQHPHILPLFDSGEADSFLYYVMPFVEGESLRSLLDRERQLEVDQAVHIAKAVASALQYAHERDIIHRDIKPENILLHAGEPVVADFGIALAISAAGGGRMTETGLSLGTPHYMSPEQAAADRDLSARSDVYSLACVLYEMLSGQPPHTGPTAQSILVRILTENPRPVSEARPTVPKHLRAVVAKGLEKLPADRFKTAEEFKAALDDESFVYEPVQRTGPVAAVTPEMVGGAVAAPGRRFLGSPIHAAVTAVLALAAGWLAFGPGGGGEASPDAPLLSAVLSDSAVSINAPRVSPDGTLAYVQDGSILIRPPGSLEGTPLPGVSGVSDFAFSPDGRWVVFTTNAGELRKVQVQGGGDATLWSESSRFALFPRWSDDGFVYFVVGTSAPKDLMRVSEVGGEAELILGSDGITLEAEPLPGGRGVAVGRSTASGTEDHIVLFNLESGDTTTLAASGFSPRWSASGHLLYTQSTGATWALPFDLDRLEATGPAVPVLEGVRTSLLVADYAVSPEGTLIYVEGAGGASSAGGFEFHLVGEDGSIERLPIAPSDHYDGRISPDGSKLAYTRAGDIWIFDLDRGSNDSLTSGGTGPHNPAWSPDGARVVYDGGTDMMIRPVDRSSTPTLVGGTDVVDYPNHWLEDGTILFQGTGGGGGDLHIIPEEGGEPTVLLNADWLERAARISPDGRWMAYVSGRSGSPQLYVRSWPDLRDEILISEDSGPLAPFGQPQWSPDGRTLYYHKGQQIYAADLDTSNGFRVTGLRGTGVVVNGWLQHMHPDGRFLIASTVGAGEESEMLVPRLIVSANWFTELRARMGGGG